MSIRQTGPTQKRPYNKTGKYSKKKVRKPWGSNRLITTPTVNTDVEDFNFPVIDVLNTRAVMNSKLITRTVDGIYQLPVSNSKAIEVLNSGHTAFGNAGSFITTVKRALDNTKGKATITTRNVRDGKNNVIKVRIWRTS